MIAFDLHLHTLASDGVFTPSKLVRTAAAAGLTGLAITDHDTLAGLDEGETAAAAHNLTFVPGVEVSAQVDGFEIHLLGYGMDRHHSGLTDFLEEQRERRQTRAQTFIQTLMDAGALPPSTAIPENASIARPHIAELLVAAGTVDTMQEAFTTFLVPGTSTFVPKPLPDGAATIAVVHEAGGVVSLAHPGHGVPHRVVQSVLASGLDGLEVWHPSHDDMLTTYYQELADGHGLLKTGGSDFHRPERGHVGSHGVAELPRALRTP